MRIIHPYARMLAPTGYGSDFTPEDGLALLKRIEWAARISHRSEDAITLDSFDRLLRSVVLQHGDWSVVEHASVSCDFYVDRGITHELVRHRLFAFTQESTRFVNYEKKMAPSFVYPNPDVRCEWCHSGNTTQVWIESEKRWAHEVAATAGVEYPSCSLDPSWLYGIGMAESTYKTLMLQGWRGQEARSVFPNALASRIIITGNLRNWRHFFLMRTSKEAHPQMRQVTIPLLAEFKTKIPILYDDIEPNATQRQNIEKGR